MKLMAKVRVLAAALGMGAALQAQAQTDLTVYTALEADQLKSYAKAFEKNNPDVRIRWVRDSTGIITARLLAEKKIHRPTWYWDWRQPACWF